MITIKTMLRGTPIQKYERVHQRLHAYATRAMDRVVLDGHRQLKSDYLRRGGSFRPTKGRGYKWVKNPGVWLRVGNGVLVSSWRFTRSTVEGNRVIGRLVTSCRYARIHEEGGLAGRNHSVRIPKRSYAEPMFRDNRGRWRTMFGTDLAGSIKAT